MMGSHPAPCKRLMGYPLRFTISDKKAINCYVSSVNKLDDFVHQVDQYARETKKHFALLYFSDHGMTVDKSTVPVRHGSTGKNNYHVPFFITTDDSDKHRDIKRTVSAYQFINILAGVAGISADQVKPVSASAINSEPVRVFNGERMVDYESLSTSKIIN